MNKEAASKIIQQAVNTIQDAGWTILPVIHAEGHIAKADIIIQEMTATQHKDYLSKKPVPVEVTKAIKE